MLINALNERASVLREEFTRARQSVVSLTEQLEQGKAHLNVVSGHLNEVAYLMGEAQKLAPEAQDAANKASQGDQGNGQAIDENAESNS